MQQDITVGKPAHITLKTNEPSLVSAVYDMCTTLQNEEGMAESGWTKHYEQFRCKSDFVESIFMLARYMAAPAQIEYHGNSKYTIHTNIDKEGQQEFRFAVDDHFYMQ